MIPLLGLFLKDIRHCSRVKRLHIQQLKTLYHVQSALFVGLEMFTGNVALVCLLVTIDFQNTDLATVTFRSSNN